MVLQGVPRRLAWWALRRRPEAVRGFLEGARLGIPLGVRLLMTMDDLRPGIGCRPAGGHALRMAPNFPGRVPPVLPVA